MPDENRIFDVSRPGHGSPQPTSKPVIVGHHPMMHDPMVRGDDAPEPTKITVHGDAEEPEKLEAEPLHQTESRPKETQSLPPEPVIAPHNEQLAPAAAAAEPPAAGIIEPPVEPAGPAQSPISPEISYEEPAEPAPAEEASEASVPPESEDHPVEPAQTPQPVPYVEGLQVGGRRRRGNPIAVIILILLILLIAAYLLIDSGVISSSIKLPVHFFKQKPAAPVSQPSGAASTSQPAGPPVPANFTKYTLAGTSITFAAPTAWGTPTSKTEQGYTARGNASKPDGTYAYIVDFPNNKDVEIAVTSSQYLPPVRTALYYDYLQWCTGTNDNKIYLSILHFSTANKVDTPSTVACDQGPVNGATKLDATTIIQPKAKYLNGQPIGDLYTKNLPNADLPVFRVKDAKSANGDDIRQLLATVQEPAQTGAGGSSGSSSP